ncbi:MAG: peptidase M52 [Nitrosomonas sp.]|nr:MAG: peptidase M52 [Nitrosomonas sp.]
MDEIMTMVIGIGNDFGSDDAAGLIAVQHLRGVVGNHVRILEQSGDGTQLIESWKNREKVVLIDAALSDKAPGTIHRFEVDTFPLPGKFLCYSTHQLGVSEAIELARALKQLPRSLIVFAIEGKYFGPGKGLSPEVAQSIPVLVDQVKREVEK